MPKEKILVAALNWGLGHASRCIPIIKALINEGFEPVLASDGEALKLLLKEFPQTTCIELPSYNVTYAKNPANLKWKLLLNTPTIIRAIRAEKKLTKKIIEDHQISGIISDNRWGVYHKKIPSAFITHQLNVLSGNTTYFSSKIHQALIAKFDECWIPDFATEKNLSGLLGHSTSINARIKYIAPLSRIQKKAIPAIYRYVIILSGPEPQRSYLENVLLKAFKDTESKTLLVRGVFSSEEIKVQNPKIIIKNYLFGEALEHALNSGKYIIARSGYSTIMDLAKIEAKAFFIPTPGQPEQEYLAKRFQKLGIAPFCTQDQFTMYQLERLKDFSGFEGFSFEHSFRDFFTLFKGK